MEHNATSHLSVFGAVRLVVHHPPTDALSEETVATLSRALVAQLPSVSRSDGQLIFSSSDNSLAAGAAPDRIFAGTVTPMPIGNAIRLVTGTVHAMMSALRLSGGYPYAVYLQHTFGAGGFDAHKALRSRSALFDDILVPNSEPIGEGYRSVFRHGGQVLDWKLETLFSDTRQLFAVLDVNSLAAPADSIEAIAADMESKANLMTHYAIPKIVDLIQNMVRA